MRTTAPLTEEVSRQQAISRSRRLASSWHRVRLFVLYRFYLGHASKVANTVASALLFGRRVLFCFACTWYFPTVTPKFRLDCFLIQTSDRTYIASVGHLQRDSGSESLLCPSSKPCAAHGLQLLVRENLRDQFAIENRPPRRAWSCCRSHRYKSRLGSGC